MAADPRKFKAPFIDKPQCRQAAEEFRSRFWPSGELPVDILGVAEFDLGLDFRPVSGLRDDADVDALLLADWKTLIVDQRQYMDDRFANRLRFSVAHEVGHLVLHKSILEEPRWSDERGWIAFVKDMPEREYGFLEFQANEFAGRLLVPLDALRRGLEGAVGQAEKNGIRKTDLTDADLSYLCIPLAKQFAVSTDVIERRLAREGLWPL